MINAGLDLVAPAGIFDPGAVREFKTLNRHVRGRLGDDESFGTGDFDITLLLGDDRDRLARGTPAGHTDGVGRRVNTVGDHDAVTGNSVAKGVLQSVDRRYFNIRG